MREAVPPIVVVEGHDLTVHSTAADACLWMEPIDVQQGVFEAFDSEGRELSIVAQGDRVSLELPSHSTAQRDELEHKLRQFIEPEWLEKIGLAELDKLTLPEMLDAILLLERKNRQRWSVRWMLSRFRPRGRR